MAKNKFAGIADKEAENIEREKLKISFEFIDWESEELFFIHGIESKYYHKLFDCITEVKTSHEKQITEQTHPSLRPKSIFNTTKSVRSSFPDTVVEKLSEKLFIQTKNRTEAKLQAIEMVNRAFEVSPSKGYGRIHGFVWNNTFNIVWFDPAHNLYPWSGQGAKPTPPAVIRGFSPDESFKLREEINKLNEVVASLEEQNSELWQQFSNS